MLVGTVAMNIGFAFPFDDEQTPGEVAATKVVPTMTEPLVVFNAQPNPDDNANVEDTINVEVDASTRKRRRNSHGEKSKHSTWSFSYDPVRSSQVCFDNAEAAQRTLSKSRPPADVKLLKNKSFEEATDELAHRLFQVNLLTCDVRRRALQSELRPETTTS